MVPDAIDSLTGWYAIALCFFFKIDVGIVASRMTESLSQNMLASPSSGIPHILSLYLKASIILTHICIAINSNPKVDVSTVLCTFLNLCMGAEFKNF
jgi:hypothetical protein